MNWLITWLLGLRHEPVDRRARKAVRLTRLHRQLRRPVIDRATQLAAAYERGDTALRKL